MFEVKRWYIIIDERQDLAMRLLMRHQKGGGLLRPLVDYRLVRKAAYCGTGGALGALLNDTKASLPTNPKAETPEPLMMLSTLAVAS